MKKIFTLIAMALVAVGVNAQKSWVFSDFEAKEYTETTVVNELTINATSDKKIAIAESEKTVTVKDAEVTYTKVLKFGGTGAANRCVSFPVSGASNITIVATSSNNTDRSVSVSCGASYGTKSLGTVSAPGGSVNVETVKYTAADATTIYIGSTNSGTNIYAIYVEAGEVEEQPAEWNFSTWADEGTGFSNQVKDNLGLFACYKNAETQITNFGKVNSSNKGSYTKRFQLGGGGAPLEGTGTPTQRFVYFNVKGNSEISVQAISGSSDERKLYITDGVNILSETTVGGSLTEAKASYTGGAGVIYIYALTAINLYDIIATNVGTTVLLDDTTKPTGINTIKAMKAANDAAIYNLAGQKVSDSFKGIAIQNGKKVVLK